MCAGKNETQPPACPRCDGQDVWRNGYNRAGKQQWRCRSCDKCFVVDPYLPAVVVTIADRLLQENLPVVLCARVMEDMVSKRWLYRRRRILNAR